MQRKEGKKNVGDSTVFRWKVLLKRKKISDSRRSENNHFWDEFVA